MNILKGTFKRLKARFGEPVTIVRDLGVFTDYGTGETLTFTVSRVVPKAVCLPYGTKMSEEPHTVINSTRKFGYGGENALAYLTFMVDSDELPQLPANGPILFTDGSAEQVLESDITSDTNCYYVDGFMRQKKDGKYGKYVKAGAIAYLAETISTSVGLDMSVTCRYGTFKVLTVKEGSENATILVLEKVL